MSKEAKSFGMKKSEVFKVPTDSKSCFFHVFFPTKHLMLLPNIPNSWVASHGMWLAAFTVCFIISVHDSDHWFVGSYSQKSYLQPLWYCECLPQNHDFGTSHLLLLYLATPPPKKKKIIPVPSSVRWLPHFPNLSMILGRYCKHDRAMSSQVNPRGWCNDPNRSAIVGQLWDGTQAVQQIRHGSMPSLVAIFSNDMDSGGRKDQRCLFCYYTCWLMFHIQKWSETTIVTSHD